MRDGQVKQHYEMEIVKLGEIRHKKRKEKKRLSRNEDDGTTFQTSFDKAKEVLSESRKHRLVWKCANPVLQMGLGGVVVEQVCPLCGESVDGSHSDLTAHVENCISRVSSADNEDSDDGGSELDTYEWCGETRIRVSSLLPSTALPGEDFTFSTHSSSSSSLFT
jgi:DNA repair exonuclease SbcCD ATPase subunit